MGLPARLSQPVDPGGVGGFHVLYNFMIVCLIGWQSFTTVYNRLQSFTSFTIVYNRAQSFTIVYNRLQPFTIVDNSCAPNRSILAVRRARATLRLRPSSRAPARE